MTKTLNPCVDGYNFVRVQSRPIKGTRLARVEVECGQTLLGVSFEHRYVYTVDASQVNARVFHGITLWTKLK